MPADKSSHIASDCDKAKAAAHTPGKWLALPNDPKADDYWRVSDGDDFICQMFSKHGEFENAKANARLIAAAPALLQACEQALRYIEADEVQHGRQFGTGNALRFAIARATGGA